MDGIALFSMPKLMFKLQSLLHTVVCLNFSVKLKLKNRVRHLKIKAEKLFEVGIKDLWKKKRFVKWDHSRGINFLKTMKNKEFRFIMIIHS